MRHGKVSTEVKINAASTVPHKRTTYRTMQIFCTIDLVLEENNTRKHYVLTTDKWTVSALELERSPEGTPMFSGWLLKVVCQNRRLTGQ
jgi:hypothetical protein